MSSHLGRFFLILCFGSLTALWFRDKRGFRTRHQRGAGSGKWCFFVSAHALVSYGVGRGLFVAQRIISCACLGWVSVLQPVGFRVRGLGKGN